MANKLTTFEKEQIECGKKIQEYKLSSEANIVASIFKNPELIYNIDLTIDDFSNNIWKCYYAIAYGLILTEKKTSLDEISVGIYLEKHPKLKQKIQEYGGYSTIEDATAYVELKNFDSYVNDLKKFNILLKLLKYGFPISDKLSEYVDKTTDEIYSELEMMLNHTFINTENNVQSYNIFDGMDKYIQDLDEGTEIGMPLHGSTILNSEIAGMHLGTIMGIGASSGVGKSWLAFNYLIPSALQYNERVVIICNEEDENRWRRELLIYVTNNILGHKLQKRELRNGKFSEEVWGWLREATDWIKQRAEEHIVTVIPLQSYNVDLAIKIIKKYSSAFGCRYFVLDTLKESNNSKTDDIFKSMTRDTIKLYDLVKPSNRNLFLMVTYQLNKIANKVRHLTNLEIGMSKSIIDVMSTNILVRRPNYDEFEGEPKAINCYKEVAGARIHFPLRKDSNYFIIFLSKNRYGRSDAFQIVAKIDMSTNEYEEVGACNILEDW